jgi:tetratricopeptide (TPR) repeat protein
MTSNPDRRIQILLLLGLVLLVFAVYYPATRAGYVWDDDAYVTENRLLGDGDGLRRIWTTTETPQYYPLVFTTFWLEHRLWGLAPTGYHIVNIALHALNACLIGCILGSLRIRGAWLVALMFALHPVHVESVAWITERKNVLSAFFYLLSFLVYLRFDGGSKRALYVFSLLLFLCALLSKTVAASLPLALLLTLYYLKGRLELRDGLRMLPFLGLAVGMSLLTVHLEEGMIDVVRSEFQFTWLQRVLIACKALLFYPVKLLVPYPLIFNYERWDLEAGGLMRLWPIAAVLLLVSLLLLLWRRGKRGIACACAFFVITISPALGAFNVYPFRYSFVADHFQYLASIGILILLVQAGLWIRRRVSWFTVPAVALLALLALLTWNQTEAYKDAKTLWEDTLSKNPGSWLANNNLALMHLDRHETEAALEHFDRAVNANPRSVESHTGRGMAYAQLGDFERALRDYDRAVELNPSYPELYMQRMELFLKLRRYSEAIRDSTLVLQSNATHLPAYRTRAVALIETEQYDRAIADLDRAIELGANQEAYNDRGAAHLRAGRPELALRDFGMAIELANEPARYLHNRAMAYSELEMYDEALSDLNDAIEADPSALNSRIARGNLLLAVFKDREGACRDWLRACQLGDCRYHERGCSSR